MVKKQIKKRKSTGRKRKVSRKSSSKLIKFLLLAGVFALFLLSVFIAYCFITLPSIEDAVNKTRQPSMVIIAQNGEEIAGYGGVYSEVVLAKDMPLNLKNAVIATEDRRFYRHSGFDIIAFLRATITNIYYRRYAQGGSTLTQQVAKNLFLNPQKNIKRKVQELLMAFWLEDKFSKEQILTLYLNRVYMGSGVYGIEAASYKYFNKNSKRLNLLESAILAGLLKAPSRYNPEASPEQARKRAGVVLQIMLNQGMITQKQKDDALKSSLPAPQGNSGKYFADWAKGESRSFIGEQEEDINIFTTLDFKLQRKAEKILQEAVEANRKNNVTNGAVVVMDKEGGIKAMVGGVDYAKSQFNRATQALRQPGSSFKTFVYLAALEEGFRKDDVVEDSAVSIEGWQPRNASKKEYGKVSLNYAFSQSLNLATVDLGAKLSRQNIIKLAQKMGISTPLNNKPSIVLGSSEVTVLEMALAYSAIANGGYATWPHSISEIYSKDGNLLYNRSAEQKIRILSEESVEEITEMLQSVIENGTGKKAQTPFFSAGKTGTSQDYRDAWFVGFSSNNVVAVWVGNDNNSPMKKISGAGLPAEIWKKVMIEAEKH